MKIKTLTLVAALCLGIGTVHAEIAKTITYQAVLKDASGARLTDTVALELNIYKASGGGTIYTDSHGSVVVVNGLFTVVIGTGTGGAIGLPFDEPYELGVTVNAGTELAPRTLLTAEPYALNTYSVNIPGGSNGDVLTNDGTGNGVWGAPGAGPQGQQGKVGPAGSDGATGTDGAAGAQGDPGPVGSEFWDGDIAGDIYNTNSGKVGIGTASPGVDFEVSGSDLHVARLTTSGFASYDNGRGILDLKLTGSRAVGKGPYISFNAPAETGVGNRDVASVGVQADTGPGTGSSARSYDIVLFNRGSDGMNERMRIKHTGNVGIGTSSPGKKLQVEGEVRFNLGGSAKIDFNTTGGDGSVYITNSDGAVKVNFDTEGDSYFTGGNVGIGTASPDQSLHIFRGSAGSVDAHSLSGLVLEDDTSLFMTFLAPANQDVGFFFGDPDSPTVGAMYYELVYDKMKFRTHQSTKMTIDSDGNVGIGTESPSTKLEVAGGDLKLSDSTPNLLINDTAESANGRLWKIASDGGYLRIQATRDDQGVNGTFLEMFRNGAIADRTNIGTRLGVGFTGGFSETFEVAGNSHSSGTVQSGPYLKIDGTSAVGVISTPTSGGYALMIQSNGGRGDFDTGAALRLNPAGDPVGIGTGTDAVTEMLVVNGNVKANDFISDTTTYPDFVFEADYSLMPLDELEAFIAREGHLPKIASEEEVRARGGVNLSQLQVQLLEKIEELTLHTIALGKRINVLESE